LDGIACRDRGSIARRSTGPLLDELLPGSSQPLSTGQHSRYHPGLGGAPIAVVEDDVAVVLGATDESAERAPRPVPAVLVASSSAPRT
jgi:hypothetical protein